jgi:hypothetical protein
LDSGARVVGGSAATTTAAATGGMARAMPAKRVKMIPGTFMLMVGEERVGDEL